MKRLLSRLVSPRRDDAASPPIALAAAELPADVVPLVLAQLGGDVGALCASACVSTHWRGVLMSASSEGNELWRTVAAARAAPRMTDARLLSLVARAGTSLLSLDVSGCTGLTDGGVASALAGQRRLRHFAAVGCHNLSAEGVWRALKGRKLDTLRVRGVATDEEEHFAWDDDDEESFVNPSLAKLRRRLKTPGNLDAVTGCRYVVSESEHMYEGAEGDELCGCLCSEEDSVCEACVRTLCSQHRPEPAECDGPGAPRCARCDARMCEDCVDAASSFDGYCCTYCNRQHCVSCIADRRVAPFLECATHGDICGNVACDACLRTKRLKTVRLQGRTARSHDVVVRFNCNSPEFAGAAE